MQKDKVAFYPGVREQDIPNLPDNLKEPLVYKLQELASGKDRGSPLFSRVLEARGCRKVYLTTPEQGAQMRKTRDAGGDPRKAPGTDGGYRIVYREARVRGTKAIVVVAIGPRKGFKAYKSAEHRLLKKENSNRSPALTSKMKSVTPQENLSPTTNSTPRAPTEKTSRSVR